MIVTLNLQGMWWVGHSSSLFIKLGLHSGHFAPLRNSKTLFHKISDNWILRSSNPIYFRLGTVSRPLFKAPNYRTTLVPLPKKFDPLKELAHDRIFVSCTHLTISPTKIPDRHAFEVEAECVGWHLKTSTLTPVSSNISLIHLELFELLTSTWGFMQFRSNCNLSPFVLHVFLYFRYSSKADNINNSWSF